VVKYELIEHTADIGIRVRGKDLKDLFKNAALAMFDIILEKQELPVSKKTKTTIEQKAEGLEELFINWLNELLSLSSAKELIFTDFEISRLDKNNLSAVAIGGNIKDYKVGKEVKAATYHQLKIEESKTGWLAEIIFDV
jgi:SHS2 domain-containing protein